MKRRLKRREGWSVAGDWKLKRRRRLEAEASRSGVSGVWSVAIWRHRRLKRRDLGVTGVKEGEASWFCLNRRQRQAENTAATAGEASPVLKKAKRRRRLGLWVSPATWKSVEL